MSELQGGQKVRVLLAQALFGNPAALLLDEPTNHLDLDSVHWLQDYLHDYEGVLIVISHDRHFLNSVCTHTADIDYQTVIMYTGGYDDMVLAKTQIRSRIESENAVREKKIAQFNEFIARFSAGTRSSQVMSRKKEVERIQTSELARSNIARPYIRFDMKNPSGRHPLEFKGLRKSYDGHKVIDKFSANVERGEKIAVIGRNGAGKTTLLKSLIRKRHRVYRRCRPPLSSSDGGHVKWGHEVAVGYFAQDTTDTIAKDTTVVEWLHQFDPKASQQELRGVLGQMLFSGEDAEKSTRAFRRRIGAPDFLQADAAKAERPGVRRAHEPPGPGSHQRAQHRFAEISRHRPVRHARSRRHRRSRHAHLAMQRRPRRGFQRPVRGFSGVREREGFVALRGAGFSLWVFILAKTKIHRLKPAPPKPNAAAGRTRS